MKIIAQIIAKIKILYKAIVLDLDETLWNGTLLEDGIDSIIGKMNSINGLPFIEFMKFIKLLGNELGVYIAICSRNDSSFIESAINILDENIFPLKYQIDCIIANNNDKSENIRLISKQLSILPNSIVFIDDNQLVRDEVKNKLPDVFIPNWKYHNEIVTQLNIACIFERTELSLRVQSRRKQHKIIKAERIANTLPILLVKVKNDDEHIESKKLYSKTNQFKFSQKNDNFDAFTTSLFFEILRNDGENLGIASTLTYKLQSDHLHIYNWAISCRFFELGLEEFIVSYLIQTIKSHKIHIDYNASEYNQKVGELIARYPEVFLGNQNSDLLELITDKENLEYISMNTNLKII